MHRADRRGLAVDHEGDLDHPNMRDEPVAVGIDERGGHGPPVESDRLQVLHPGRQALEHGVQQPKKALAKDGTFAITALVRRHTSSKPSLRARKTTSRASPTR